MFIDNDVPIGSKLRRSEIVRAWSDAPRRELGNCRHLIFRSYGAAVLTDTPVYKHYVPQATRDSGRGRNIAHEKKS